MLKPENAFMLTRFYSFREYEHGVKARLEYEILSTEYYLTSDPYMWRHLATNSVITPSIEERKLLNNLQEVCVDIHCFRTTD